MKIVTGGASFGLIVFYVDRVYLDVWKKCDGELEEQLGLMWACIHFM